MGMAPVGASRQQGLAGLQGFTSLLLTVVMVVSKAQGSL